MLGFRSKESVKDKFNIKPSIFMVPDEDRYTGSCSFFAHFVERMNERSKVAFGRLVARKSASVKLVALIPQVILSLTVGGKL